MIESVRIYDTVGNDVTASFYVITYPGKVHVYDRVLSFVSDSYTKVYDGLGLVVGRMTDGQLEDGHKYTITSTAKSDVGLQINTYDVKVVDGDGRDVTDFYYLDKKYGSVNILPVGITIKAGDAQKVYDGTPLTCSDVIIESGTLIKGHSLGFCQTTGSQTELGRSDNIITYVSIYDAEGNDVTSNYEINLKTGKLRVTNS